MTATVHVIRDLDVLARLAPEWEQLLANASNNTPVLSPLWQLAWWQVFGPVSGRALRAVAVREGGALVALAPMCRRMYRYYGCLPFRRLELSASGEHEADEICSDYLGVLCARGSEPAVAPAFARVIASGELDESDELVMPRMDGDHALPRLLRTAIEATGMPARLDTEAQSPHIALPASFEAYLAKLPAQHRYTVRRSLRDFEKWAGSQWTMHVVRTPAELAGARRILEKLHAEQWSAHGKPGAFASERFSAFHDRVMPALLARDALELMWIEARGEPFAALYCLRWQGVVHFYLSGRRLDLDKLRPGIVAHALAIKRAIEAGCREYDFLAGASRYKLMLATSLRSLVTLRAVRRGALVERARQAAHTGAGWLRAMKRRGSAKQPRPAGVEVGEL
jgi:CelD/BcsL family acetyltransferase involved in cellulose biosynthesis